jgi:signal peptidase
MTASTVLKRGLGALVLGVALASSGAALLLWHQGYRLYAVRTGSMEPALPPGTLLFDAPARPGHPVAGQVITFHANAHLVTHRVVGATTQGLTTKGDANRSADAWVIPQANVVGVVDGTITSGGYVLVFLQQRTGIASVLAFALSGCFAWSLFFPAERPAPSRGKRRLEGLAGTP